MISYKTNIRKKQQKRLTKKLKNVKPRETRQTRITWSPDVKPDGVLKDGIWYRSTPEKNLSGITKKIKIQKIQSKKPKFKTAKFKRHKLKIRNSKRKKYSKKLHLKQRRYI